MKDRAGLLLTVTSANGWKISRTGFPHVFAVLGGTDFSKGELSWSCKCVSQGSWAAKWSCSHSSSGGQTCAGRAFTQKLLLDGIGWL